MKVIDRILYKNVVSGDMVSHYWGNQSGAHNRVCYLNFKNHKPYDFYKSSSAMPENKWFNDTNKIETT